MTVRNATNFPTIFLEGTALEQVATFKYLGVILSSDLSWTPQVDSVCTKARKVLGLLYRRFHNNAGCDTLLEMYTTLIRPHLEYAAPVWNPYTASNINKLEDTQKFALRICSKQWNLGYQELLDLTCLPTLENRCLYFKMCTLYKIVYNLIYFPPDVITPKLNSTALLPLLHQPFSRTTAHQSSFVPSSVSLWNNLPHNALLSTSVPSFKSSVHPLFLYS